MVKISKTERVKLHSGVPLLQRQMNHQLEN